MRYLKNFVRGILFVLLSAAAVSATGQARFPTLEGQLRLDPEHYRDVFNQCSRSTPEPSGELWTPAQREVEMLEGRVATFLAEIGARRYLDPRMLRSAYRGQYVGFWRNGRKLIYASYTNSDPAIRGAMSTGTAVRVCDGGPGFWGIVFEVEKDQLSEFHTNGR